MDPIIIEILAQLVRNGALLQDDIAQIADRVAKSGRDKDAHNIRVSFIEGLSMALPPEESSQVRARRAYMHVVALDGGNADA